MSQTTPRKHQNASYSPHSHAPAHSSPRNHHQHQQYQQNHQQQQQHQQHQYQYYAQQNTQAQYAHARSRSQQLRAQAAVEQQMVGAAASNTSDYESDTAHYMAAHPGPPQAALAARTNTELNLGVLRRYRPRIASILSITASAVVYVFNTASSKWDKANLEGTLFICAQTPQPRQQQQQRRRQQQQQRRQRRYDEDDEDEYDETDDYSDDAADSGEADGTTDGLLFILNRKNLTNLTLDLRAVADYELATDLLIFRLYEDDDAPDDDDDDAAVTVPMENREPARPKVLGLWLHAENDEDRATGSALIYELWTKARAAALRRRRRRQQQQQQQQQQPNETSSASQSSASPAGGPGPAPAALGRQVTLNELFGRSQNGFGGA
ncbi:PH domain-like protein [Hypoxylon sp. FL1284]|nr:PH domain-like protein [Hypoxylon sp. FL1284]